MKIAISSFGPNLTSQLSPRFRGGSYILIVDPDDMQLEVIENDNSALWEGKGLRVARFMASKNVKALITGRCRPSTFRILTEAGIFVYLKQSGTVKEVLDKYIKGRLRRATAPTARARTGVTVYPLDCPSHN